METYIGVKAVKARPMTRGEWYRFNGWRIPATEDENENGYLVVYSDDYKSWSPKTAFDSAYRPAGEDLLDDTVMLMRSDDFKDRFRAEYRQTKIRYDRLHNMIVKYEAGTLGFEPRTPIEVLKDQASAMGDYLYALELRAEMECIVV